MGIKVTGNATGAVAYSVKPRASVVVVDPVTSVSYSLAAASVAYIELGITAELDTTGRFKFIADTVVTTDGIALSLSKPLQDAFSLEDVATKDVGKALADEVSFEDSLLVTLIFLRDFADTFEFADQVTLDIAKAAVDSVAMSEALAYTLSKPFADAQSIADSASLAVAKALTDTIELQDAASITYDKLLADASEIVDLIVFSIDKAITDSQPMADELSITHDKSLADGFAMNDGFGATDGFDFSLSTTFSNVAFITDSVELSTQSVLADSVGITDSGSIISQDYCDITYFAEDYVGTATFF
jgi:hypothetical protein